MFTYILYLFRLQNYGILSIHKRHALGSFIRCYLLKKLIRLYATTFLGSFRSLCVFTLVTSFIRAFYFISFFFLFTLQYLYNINDAILPTFGR